MPVDLQMRDGVAVLALQRPPVNALDLGLVHEITQHARAALGDASVRALVLTGAPGVFSAGLDTKLVPTYDTRTRQKLLRALNEMVFALYGSPKPVVGAISGHALAGGLVLALTADARLVARGEWKFGLPEVEAGIPFPACALALVRAELSPEMLRRMALASLPSPSEPLLAAGLVDRVVDASALLDESVREAHRLAALPGFARVKAQLRSAVWEPMRRAVELDEDPLLHDWI